MIDYSLLTEEEFKKLRLLGSFIVQFGRETVLNQTLHFDPSLNDVKIIFEIINKEVYDNAIKPLPTFQFKTIDNSKGSFGWREEDKDGNFTLLEPPRIGFMKQPEDSFLNVASIIAHETIHYYDLLFGPLSQVKMNIMKHVNGTQFVGNYDVHGNWFQKQVDNIWELGIDVQQHFYTGTRYLKTDDNGLVIKDDGTIYEAVKNNYASVEFDSDSRLVKYSKKMFKTLKSDALVKASTKDGIARFVIA